MRRPRRVEYFGVGQPDHARRAFLFGKLGEGLVAGQVDAGRGVLGKGHAGHVVQHRADGVVQRLYPAGLLRRAPVFCLFVVHHHRVQQAGSQHVADGVERQIGEPELNEQKGAHYESEKRQRPVFQPFVRRIAGIGRDGVHRDHEEQDYLQGENHIAKGEDAVGTVAVHNEQHRRKDIDDDEQGDKSGDEAPGVDEEAPETAVLVQIRDGVFRPEHHARRHRDEIDGRVGKEQRGQLSACKDAPQDIRDVIRQNGEQEPPVRPPGRLFKGAPEVHEDVLILDQQYQNRKQTNRGIIHAP